ncbi:hypothetical protein [Corynebacterium auriscanis]|uniref:hypothetical protein n=1 Tax=Corynebacterium auriscanis TaxID=99807 RepID=UPI003CF78699
MRGRRELRRDMAGGCCAGMQAALAGVAPGYGRRGLRWDAGGGWWGLRRDAGGGWWVLRWDAGGGWRVLRRGMAGGLFEVPGAGVFALRDKCAAEVRQKRVLL